MTYWMRSTRSKASVTAMIAAALVVAGASAVGLEAQASGEYRLSGREVTIYNLAGSVEVMAGQGSDVVVTVEIGGDDGDELRVESGELDGHERLRVIYPDDQIVYRDMGRGSRTTMRVRSDGTFGDRIRGRGGDRVRISGSGRGLEAWADLRISVPAGKEFSVYLGVGEIHAENVDGRIRLDTGSGSVVARSMSGVLFVDTGSGSVEVMGMEGDLSVDTGSGSVRIDDVTGDDVLVDTGSGSVRGGNLRSRSLRVDTGSGSVELDRIFASDILVDTGSGSVVLELMEDVDDLEVDTGSGGVTLYVPEDIGAEVEFDTGSGGIDLDVPVQVESVRRDYVRGVLGDGRGRMVVDTGSGGIRIRRR